MAKAKKAKAQKEVDKKASSKKDVDILDIARKDIEKKYGKVISTMGEKGELFIPTISTGSINLDFALQRGGFAKGRVYEVYGHPSGGKTTLTMSLIAQAQKRGMECVFVDAEQAADPKLFKAMRVNIDRLHYIEAFTGDDNLDILEALIKTGKVDVAVVDSVAALIPKSEANAEMDDQFMGLHARLMAKACRKFTPLCAKTNTLLVFINQTRSKIGSYGNPETTTGGISLDYYASGSVRVKGGQTKESKIFDANGDLIGHHTEFEVKKNRFGPPGRKASVPLIYGVGYDSHWEVLNLGVDTGLIDKSGSWFSYNDIKIGQGEANARNFLRENDTVYKEIRNTILDYLLLSKPDDPQRLTLKDVYEQNGG